MSLHKQKLYDITLLRVVSMLMIVLCHLIGYYDFIPGSKFLGQFFNVGVYSFLLISGYLYGLKEKKPFRRRITSRLTRIYLPVVSLVIVDLILLFFLFDETYSVATVTCYLSNLQGLAFISWDLFSQFFVQIDNLSPLWFASIIMLCYCQIPLLHYIRGGVHAFGSMVDSDQPVSSFYHPSYCLSHRFVISSCI